MWHEARKQEKKIRGIMVDYKRRAERRREYYEKIKQDPAQFLQVHGRPAKIHLDPAVSMAADSPATMMPWQGDASNLIDRFDVRAHLDIIPQYVATVDIPKPNSEETAEERQINYERYRTLVQNDFLGVNEDKFLHQIFLEERYGPVLKPGVEDEKKKLSDKKAAIGYIYEDSSIDLSMTLGNQAEKTEDDLLDDDEDKDEDLSDIDLDVAVDVTELSPAQCVEMNEQSIKYAMVDDDFITFLLLDKEEAEQLKLAREIEEEKAMYSGRKSRRERRALREKKLQGRKITSPPSYAARDSPTYKPNERHSTSKSRSRSPPEAGRVMFITCFGGEASDDEHRTGKKGTDKSLSSKKSSSLKHHKKPSKVYRSNKSPPGVEIGPQLPSQEKEVKKNSSSRTKSKHCSSSSSSRGSPSPRRRSKKHHESPLRSRRSRRPSRSNSPPSRRSKYRGRKDVHRSRSRSPASRPKSPHTSRSHSRSRSTSKSTSVCKEFRKSPQPPSPPVKSYYRHSLSRSNSEISDDSEQEKKDDADTKLVARQLNTTKLMPLMGKKAGPSTKPKMTPQERLKKKMQIALNRQYKADKRAELQKTEKQLQERQDRAEELREMAIKLRQRERERRHKMREYEQDPDSDRSWKTALDTIDDYNSITHGRKRTNSSSSSHSSVCSSSIESVPPPTPIYSKRQRSARSRSHSSSRSRSHRNRSPVSEPKRSPVNNASGQRGSFRRSPVRNRSPRKSSPRHDVWRRSPPRTSSRGSYRDSRYRSPSPMRRSPTCHHPNSRRTYHSFSSSKRRDRRSRSNSRSHSVNRHSRPLVDY